VKCYFTSDEHAKLSPTNADNEIKRRVNEVIDKKEILWGECWLAKM